MKSSCIKYNYAICIQKIRKDVLTYGAQINIIKIVVLTMLW